MSNETKWTKGKWSVGYGNGLYGDVISWQCYLDEKECKSLPIRCGKEAVTVINYSIGVDDIVHKANAHLIAAAPELYEALSKLKVAAYEACADSSCNDALEYAEMVLAKARGESHD